jgi:hypothetical protein
MQERPLSGLRWASLADDTLLFTRKDETPRTFREARINGSFSTPLWGGKLNLNAEAGRENFRTSLDSFGFNAAGAATDPGTAPRGRCDSPVRDTATATL